jgi:hypothetical protein
MALQDTRKASMKREYGMKWENEEGELLPR